MPAPISAIAYELIQSLIQKDHKDHPVDSKNINNTDLNSDLNLILLPDMPTALNFYQALSFFLERTQQEDKKLLVYELLHFPDTEVLPYDNFSPHEDLVSERALILHKLLNINNAPKKYLITLTLPTALQKLPPKEFLTSHSLILKTGQRFDLTSARLSLEKSGYHLVNQIEARGEYAVRGSILDIFPMGSETAYRIDLLDDEIDAIFQLNLDTQRSIDFQKNIRQSHSNYKKIEQIDLLPTREYPQDNDSFNSVAENLTRIFGDRAQNSSTFQMLTKKQKPSGLETYLPLFFKQPLVSFLDYCQPENKLENKLENKINVFLIQPETYVLSSLLEKQFENIKARYLSLKSNIDRPLLPPEQLYFPVDQLFQIIKQFSPKKISCEDNKTHKLENLFNLKINPKSRNPWENLENFIKNHKNYFFIFSAESEGRRAILKSNLETTLTKNLGLNTQHFTFVISGIADGFIHQDFIFITESDLFFNTALSQRGFSSNQLLKNKIKNAPESAAIGIYDLTELTPGMTVVHIQHGVGKYLGLNTLEINQTQQDFLTLEYAENNKLYLPISQLHLISHYSSANREAPKLSSLGNHQWQKELEKAEKKIYDTAAELLEIYARRSQKPGFKYKIDDTDYLRFSAEFSFEETPDQNKAIMEILGDLKSDKPMDRLLCGDVGFGKTEVAMRAAFVAVHNQKQVAVLVPTTLLANQHYETFSNRFAHWPINIQMLSRFKTPKEIKEILLKLEQGQVDIIIGTHKLLSHLINFKNLGLIIIDEEHRFGVRDKEKLKALRAEVDMLAMTATPIPRTLNLSLSHVRDLSMITTPPKKRLSIKTFVIEKNNQIIKEALLRETLRGGQVYFLHNDVSTMELIQQELKSLLPDLSFGIAHGQLPERTLEKIMSDFYHARFQVLICSTIIETGIDIPNANTILINRADHLGLAQLHQLRGRVGRSHHQAYAYLLTPPWESLTKDAQQRLEAIIQTKELGSGLALASHDLEIRGAGEILGEEQSGHMQHIGFSLYMELLEESIKNLQKDGKAHIDLQSFRKTTEVDLGQTAILPEYFIPDVSFRLYFYRKLSQVKDLKTLEDIQVELIDRFGLLPIETQRLIQQTEIKLLAEPLGITQIKAYTQTQSIKINFHEKNMKINPQKIIYLIQTQPQVYKLSGPYHLTINLSKISSNPNPKENNFDSYHCIKTTLEKIL